MSEDDPERAVDEGSAQAEGAGEEEEEEAASPFDHPAFLPVLLAALALWFGFDGWFSETIEAVRFNRYGFFFLVGFAIYFTVGELTSVRFLLPALYALFTLWLTGFSLFGADDAWWRDDPGARWFNQIGAGVCAVMTLYFAIREARR